MLLTISLISSCSKDKKQAVQEHEFIPEALTRDWKLSEEFYGTGGGGDSWTPVPKANQYTIKFASGNIFTYSVNFPMADSGFNRYELKTDTLKLYSTMNAKKDSLRILFLNARELQISSLSQLCFEGCASKLTSVF